MNLIKLISHQSLASYRDADGGEKTSWYPLFVHACNYRLIYVGEYVDDVTI